MVNSVPSLSSSIVAELPTPSPSSCFSTSPVPFPANESEGMRQAWYLLFKPEESLGCYEVERQYPLEVEEMNRRWRLAAGIPVRVAPQDFTSFDKRCVDTINATNRFARNHPKLFYAATITILTGTVGAALFFSGRNPLSLLSLLK